MPGELDLNHDYQTDWEWHDLEDEDGWAAIRLAPGTHPVRDPRQLADNPGRLYYMSRLLQNSNAPAEAVDWQDWESFDLDEEGGLIIVFADLGYEPPPEEDYPLPSHSNPSANPGRQNRPAEPEGPRLFE